MGEKLQASNIQAPKSPKWGMRRAESGERNHPTSPRTLSLPEDRAGEGAGQGSAELRPTMADWDGEIGLREYRWPATSRPGIGWIPQLTAGNGEQINLKPGNNRRHPKLIAKYSGKTARKNPYIRIYSTIFASRDRAEVLAEAGSRTCPPPFSFPTRAERGERNVKMRKPLSTTAFENWPRKNVRLLFASCSLNFLFYFFL